MVYSSEIDFLTFPISVLQCLTMNTLTIRLPNDLKSDLQKLSREQNKPVSDIVRESIRRYVAVEKFRALRKKALPFAEAQGFLTDEDIFKAIS
jgi:predicted transcriptional regulator